jgi:uncharacterized protein YdeI (YjbR/CyaY-like superfamily)
MFVYILLGTAASNLSGPDAFFYSSRISTRCYAEMARGGMWCTGGAVKVPYAKKWQKEADKLRKIALDCDLSEEMKWGKPCFTYQKKNVAIVIPLKDACALSFFKGALLKDPKHILQKIGAHTQAGRWIKFTSLKEITAVQSILRSCIQEAIKVEK